MNRFLHISKVLRKPKSFYVKPGFRWVINSLGIDANGRRQNGIFYPASIIIMSINEDRVNFIDERGGGQLKVGELMRMYDSDRS